MKRDGNMEVLQKILAGMKEYREGFMYFLIYKLQNNTVVF